ncbi:MAG: flagellar motor protein MotB [Rhodospirillaceae bacterium]
MSAVFLQARLASPQTGVYGLPSHIGPVPQYVARTAGRVTPWLITIVDLITLLLSFFVLLFSMSQVEPKRFNEVARSYGDAFAPAKDDSGRRLPKITAAAGDDLAYLQAVLKAAFASSPALKDIEFRSTPQYLMLTLPVTDLFIPGSGGFAESAKTPVFDLSGVLSNLKNRIAVVGTAAMMQANDNQSESDAEGAWSLAMARAQAMADALAAGGYDQPVTVLGRGGAATDVAAAIGRVEIMVMPEQATP